MDGENFNFLQAKHYYLDAPKEPRGTCFVLQVDFARVTERLSDEWASNQALMKLLSDEKHKVAALEARRNAQEQALRWIANMGPGLPWQKAVDVARAALTVETK